MTEGRKRKLSDSLPADPPPYDQGPSNKVAAVADSPTTPNMGHSENDESAVSAAEVLANLAHLPGPEGESSVALPMSSTSLADLERQQHPIVLGVSAVSKHPIVTNAIKYYEDLKKNYASLNYAAGIVEKAAMPVFSKIEVNLNSMHQARLHEARRDKKRRVTPTEKTETKKRLKFCLHILKLANRQINDRVNCLQRVITDNRHQEQLSTPQLEEKGDDTHTFTRSEPLSESRLDTELTAVSLARLDFADPQETQTEIVTTVKKIIHVISNFRPSSLVADKGVGEGQDSEDLRLKSTIREIILNLPNQVQHSSSSSLQTNDKIVTFAKESLNIIGRLTTVFNNQLEKAESWVDGEEEEEQQQQQQYNNEKAGPEIKQEETPLVTEHLKH